MNLQDRSRRLQRLVDGTLDTAKGIRNVLLGVSRTDPPFAWSGAAGYANPARHLPMQADTPFFIASITKMYTAAATMMLQERGELHLDDRISDHLPKELIRGLHHYRGKDYTDSLTIRHLLGQTSGLPDYFLDRTSEGKNVLDRLVSEGDREWTLEEVAQLTRNELPAHFPPSSPEETNAPGRAHYSDTNYMLLGAIIESVAEKPFHELCRELLFEPLGLDHTYLYGHPRTAASTEPAQMFYRDQPFSIPRFMSSHGPDGGIVSTVADTLRFERAFMSGDLFANKDTLKAMQRWNPIFFQFQYGYGTMRFKLPWLLSPFGYSPELIGHSGASGSFLYHCPELDLYVAGTTNQMTRRNAPFQLMIKVCRLFKRYP